MWIVEVGKREGCMREAALQHKAEAYKANCSR